MGWLGRPGLTRPGRTAYLPSLHHNMLLLQGLLLMERLVLLLLFRLVAWKQVLGGCSALRSLLVLWPGLVLLVLLRRLGLCRLRAVLLLSSWLRGVQRVGLRLGWCLSLSPGGGCRLQGLGHCRASLVAPTHCGAAVAHLKHVPARACWCNASAEPAGRGRVQQHMLANV